MNNKLEVIGIDHGWSMMKTISQVFVTGVKEITTTPALFGDVLEYEGKFYKVGTVRQEVKDTKAHIMSDRRKLSLNTIMIAVDISAYFGEVFIKNNPNIYWGYLSKPKKLHGVNRPRLLGFAGDMSVYVYGRVEVCIWKTIETVDNMHLFNMYQVCLKMI